MNMMKKQKITNDGSGGKSTDVIVNSCAFTFRLLNYQFSQIEIKTAT